MLRIKSVVVRPDRIVAVVGVEAPFPPYTSPEMAGAISERFPDLAAHACVNARGPQFGDVMERTSTPHLLEHVAIDLQAEEYTRRHPDAKNPPLLTGATKWTDREAGIAQVQMSFFDDLVALAALRDAARVLNEVADRLCSNGERA